MYQIKFLIKENNKYLYYVNKKNLSFNSVDARKYKTIKGARIALALIIKNPALSLKVSNIMEIENDGYGIK